MVRDFQRQHGGLAWGFNPATHAAMGGLPGAAHGEEGFLRRDSGGEGCHGGWAVGGGVGGGEGPTSSLRSEEKHHLSVDHLREEFALRGVRGYVGSTVWGGGRELGRRLEPEKG